MDTYLYVKNDSSIINCDPKYFIIFLLSFDIFLII